jgi:hypothetical protein
MSTYFSSALDFGEMACVLSPLVAMPRQSSSVQSSLASQQHREAFEHEPILSQALSAISA